MFPIMIAGTDGLYFLFFAAAYLRKVSKQKGSIDINTVT